MTILTQLKPLLHLAYAQKKGRPSKIRPAQVSRQLELKYINELKTISHVCQKQTDKFILPALSPIYGDSAVVIVDGLLSRAKNAIQAAKDDLVTKVTDAAINKLAETIVNAQQKISDKVFVENIRKATNLDIAGILDDGELRAAIEESVAANVRLIKSLPEQYFNAVEMTILNGLQEGKGQAAITEDLVKIGDKTNHRAALIASDQLGKINSRLTQVRQQKLGVTHYYWVTCYDERVRHNHKARHGKLFAWADPPDDGHPGIPIRCRCLAMPYLEPLLDPDAPTPEEIMKNQ